MKLKTLLKSESSLSTAGGSTKNAPLVHFSFGLSISREIHKLCKTDGYTGSLPET